MAARDPRTPWHAKAFAAAVAAYAFSPIDLIPDFIPVLGYLDELILLPVALWLALKMIPREVLDEHRAAAETAARKPVSRVAAAGILLVWIAVSGLAALAAVCALR